MCHYIKTFKKWLKISHLVNLKLSDQSVQTPIAHLRTLIGSSKLDQNKQD